MSGVTIPVSDLFTAALASEWLAQLLSASATVGLDTTAWESGGAALTEFQVMSQSFSQEDGIASMFAQGGFLDYAATGTVTYTSANGQPTTVPVTPEFGPGLLDALASSVYDVTRLPATFAQGTVSLINASGASYGPFPPGTYHVSDPSTRATYHNTSTLTIAPSATTDADFTADAIGPAGTAGAGAINQPVTSLVGVTITNPQAIVGNQAEKNVDLAARCRLSLAMLSPNGPPDAYRFAALSAEQPPFNVVFKHGRVTRVQVALDTTNGVVDVTVANASGPVPGIVGKQVTGATNASPIVVSIASTTGLAVGDLVTVSGVSGNVAANGTWIVGPTLTGGTFQLYHLDGVTPSTGSGAYTAGGVVEGGDLGQLDAAIQAHVVPGSVTELTESASTLAVTFAVTVYVSSDKAAQVTGDVQTAVTNYLAAFPIGGVTTSSPNQLPFDAVIGAIFEGAPYCKQVTMLMNGGTADILVGASQVPVVSGSIAVTVILV